MKEIFLSYAQGNKKSADEVCRVLDKQSVSYFIAERHIPPADPVEESIKTAIRECTAVLVVVTPASIKSQWVSFEIGFASACGKRIISYITDSSIDLPQFIKTVKYLNGKAELRAFFEKPKALQLLSPSPLGMDEPLEKRYCAWWDDQNKSRRDTVVHFQGLDFIVHPEVFSPDVRLTYSSTLAARHLLLNDLKEKSVLDLGTGCGVLAILAAIHGAKQVLATDVEENAVRNASDNVKRHKLEERIQVIKSDLFNEINYKFDIIVANLPIDKDASMWSHLPEKFDELIHRFAKQVSNYLTPGGKAYLTWASFGEPKLVPQALIEAGLKPKEFCETTFGAKWQVFEIVVK